MYLRRSDRASLHKPQMPIVICGNGNRFYAPTERASDVEHFKWQIINVCQYLRVSRKAVSEIETSKLSAATHNIIRTCDQTMKETLTFFEERIAATAGTGDSTSLGMHGVGQVKPVGRGRGSGTSGDQGLQSSPAKKKKRYTCTLCEETFARSNELQGHMSKVHDVNRLVCPHCPEPEAGKAAHVFGRKATLERHIKTKHDDVWKFTCNICQWRTTDALMLEAHMVSIHKIGNWHECPNCQKKFPGQTNLNRHMRHTCDKGTKTRFHCQLCPLSYRSATKLEEHVSSKHSSSSTVQQPAPPTPPMPSLPQEDPVQTSLMSSPPHGQDKSPTQVCMRTCVKYAHI